MFRYRTPRSRVIEAQPKIDGCDYVFPSRAKTPFSGFGKSKARLDKAVLVAHAEACQERGEG